MDGVQDQPTAVEYRKRLLETLTGYRKTCVLIACSELGVFEALSEASLSARSLAQKLETSERGLLRLLDAAVGLGLLVKEGPAYRNSPLAEACLAPESPYFLGNFIRLEEHFYRRWGRLIPAVRTGRPQRDESFWDIPEKVRTFQLAMADLAKGIAPEIAAVLSLPEDRPLRAIDVGGGHGAYSTALAQRFPALTAEVLELPRVTAFAQGYIAEAGFGDRITVRAGDYRTDDLGADYDIALAIGVLGGLSQPDGARLIHKIFATLRPAGQIVLHNPMVTSARTAPKEAVLHNLWMLIASEAGEVSTADEIVCWLREAGFTHLRFTDLRPWTDAPLVTARKPEPEASG